MQLSISFVSFHHSPTSVRVRTLNRRTEFESANLERKTNEVQRLIDSIQHISTKMGNVAETAADFERRRELIQALPSAQDRLESAQGELT